MRSASACWPFLALVLAVAALAPPSAASRSSSTESASALRAIDAHRAEASRPGRAIRRQPSTANEAAPAARPPRQPPHRSAWLCIHRHEGPWTDDGAPYYGGLQMDLSFQRAYGPALLRRKGTANRWTPLEQMWVAERALKRGTGFHPWPNAARLCGLL